MVPAAESAPPESVPVGGSLPWRMVLGHLLAFLTGVGLIAGFKALGVSAEYLLLLAPLIYLLPTSPASPPATKAHRAGGRRGFFASQP